MSEGPFNLRYVGLVGPFPGSFSDPIENTDAIFLLGDERPCQRCIKRGLQDACYDGVRKKAKYLHDTPHEALNPGAVQSPAGTFFNVPDLRSGMGSGQPLSPQGYPGQAVVSAQRRLPSFDPFPSQGAIPHTFSDTGMETPVYTTQQSPISAHFQSNISPHGPQMQSMAGMLQQNRQPLPFTPTFDPNDPTTYNFDPASYNFGNHYGALEFGMLGHMSSGAAETPSTDITPQLTSQGNDRGYTTPGTIPSNFSSSPINQQAYAFSMNQQPAPTSFQSATSTPSHAVYKLGHDQHGPSKTSVPPAFTVSQPSDFSSPTESRSQSVAPGFEKAGSDTYSPNASRQHHHKRRPPDLTSSYLSNKSNHSLHQSLKSPSEIYSHFTQPYPYTDGFHSLIAYLQRRFPSHLTLRIAKALASIRPSFISCTSNLTREDLVFMEKQFQRCLYQYEGSIERCGTPTLVLRRTGEIAAVGLEFSILTGWARDILLGWEKNRNVNHGERTSRRDSSANGRPGTADSGSSVAAAAAADPSIKLEDATAATTFTSNPGSGATSTTASPHTSRTGVTTTPSPSQPQQAGIPPNRPPHRPVFIPELLDDDSAVQFYEDFATLAFGDSRGSVKRKGRLLRYVTQEEEERGEVGDSVKKKRTIECAYCWTVKRDVFEVPMVIVLNVSLPGSCSAILCRSKVPTRG